MTDPSSAPSPMSALPSRSPRSPTPRPYRLRPAFWLASLLHVGLLWVPLPPAPPLLLNAESERIQVRRLVNPPPSPTPALPSPLPSLSPVPVTLPPPTPPQPVAVAEPPIPSRPLTTPPSRPAPSPTLTPLSSPTPPPTPSPDMTPTPGEMIPDFPHLTTVIEAGCFNRDSCHRVPGSLRNVRTDLLVSLEARGCDPPRERADLNDDDQSGRVYELSGCPGQTTPIVFLSVMSNFALGETVYVLTENETDVVRKWEDL
ncbi:MAG: hypothetical protein HC910_00215 [Spirulinaceae cyanobacterium SM2_1_0]|nr:hypothetical protein [Spirulinaceae cyanobacterium SM2_1_0]